jgi:hypothetical protein
VARDHRDLPPLLPARYRPVGDSRCHRLRPEQQHPGADDADQQQERPGETQ